MNSSKSPYFVMQAVNSKPKRNAPRSRTVLDIPSNNTKPKVLEKNYMVKNEESGPSIKQEIGELNIKHELSDSLKIDFPGIKQEIDFLGIKKELCDLPNIKEDVAWFPQDWEAVYLSIRKMRENRTAPVDSMGCERCNDVDAPPQVQR